MRKGRVTVVAAVGLMLAMAASAQAYSITMEMGGLITSVSDGKGVFPDLAADDSWSVSYTFESTTADQDPGGSVIGLYAYTDFDFEMDVTVYGESAGDIHVIDDWTSGSTYDQYLVRSELNQIGAYASAVVSVHLKDSTSSVFSNDSLLLSPIDFGYFDELEMRLFDTTEGLDIYGDIHYWTPEPTSLLLLIGGLPLLRRRRVA